jgi:hypothetical protein
MSYNDRIEAALAAIKQHNEAVGGEGKTGYINPDDFIQCVKASGGTSEERLSALSHEDLLACMPSSPNGVKPRVLAKEVADIFRSKSAASKTDDKRPVSGKKAEKMTPRELVEAFDPEDYSNPVGVRLATISKGEKFIVYSDGRIVDVDTTFKLLSEIKGGYPGRDDVDVNGAIKKTYRIGELPENYADENPLYRDRPLRPDGTCDQTGRSWEGVDLSVRQLIRVAMDEGELRVTHEIAHDTLDAVMEAGALKKLRSRYRKAAIKFDELAKTGDLPTLKIPLDGGSKSTSPFSGGKQVVWGQSPALPNAYISSQSPRNFRAGGSGTFTNNIAPK